MLTVLAPIFVLHLMAAVSPGPAVLMAARIGLTRGLRTGTALALGIGTGAVAWAAAALFGLATLFEVAPAALTLLKIAGALYLFWLAIGMWRGADAPLASSTESDRAPMSLKRAFLLGLTTQLANPKPAVLFAAIFIGAVPQDSGWPLYSAILAIVFANETLWNIFVARLFAFERARTTYLNLKSVIDRVLGGLLAALGAKIAAS
jgi:threonine efflux protein